MGLAHKLNRSEIAKQAIERIGLPYDIERAGQGLPADQRHALRQAQSQPLLVDLKIWLMRERVALVNADVTARAIDYRLRRWPALTLHLSDARVPVDNNAVENAVENAIRPLAIGRKNWLFVGS